MFVRRQGDLILVENDRLATQIQRKLREIDPKLFLERQLRISDQTPCWYVMFEGGGDEEPSALMEWSDPTGRPLELSWSLVDRVVSHRLDLSPRRALAAGTAKAANERHEKEMADWSFNEHVAIAEEITPLLAPGHSAVLPRGVYLRMHRDKMRARGMKVSEMANMTFAEMQDEVIRYAMNESNRPQVKSYLNDYYRRIWNLIDWPFKIPEPAVLAVTQGDATPTPPADLGRVTSILDDEQNELAGISQEQYDSAGFTDPDQTGKPNVYWTDGRTIRLGPIPNASYTYSIRYERTVTHRDAAGVAVAGPMTETDDQLYWDGYELMVVFGARATAKVHSNNPTWPGDQDQADSMLLDMMSEFFPSSSEPLQYGRDMLGYR